MRALLVVLFTMSMTAAGAAQWVKYPTAGVPRLPNSSVNLNAPSPRAPGGRPDFSGLWTGASAIPDPACIGKPGCIGQEPIPIQAIHIALTAPDQYQRLRSGGMSLFDLLPYQASSADLVKRRFAFQQGAGPSENGAHLDPHSR